ncbi:MAG: isopenicillin N synthase family dioxygenase [Gammaproteobacteria bacterium]
MNAAAQVCPQIDLGPYYGGSPGAAEAIAASIDRALRSTGFFMVTNHAVAPATVEAMSCACRAFFDLPLAEKMAIRNTASGSQRGYVPFGDSALAFTYGASSPPDLKESFAMGPPALPQGEAAGECYAPNVWPARPVEFRAAVEAYYAAMGDLARDLLRLFALALSMPEDFFDAGMAGHNSTLRAFNYPDLDATPLPGQLRAGEHTDYGLLTLLAGDAAPGGLQVRNRAGQWFDVVPPAGAFVVNIGDLMMYWTNDVWLSNVHRVAVPPADRAGSTRRQSIAYFANPREDVRVECLPTCIAPGQAPRNPPVGAGEHRVR